MNLKGESFEVLLSNNIPSVISQVESEKYEKLFSINQNNKHQLQPEGRCFYIYRFTKDYIRIDD